jgi:TPR repeat protein
VSQDVVIARQWLNAAAEQGLEEAAGELERLISQR